MKFVVHDELGRRAVEEIGGGVDVEIFLDAECSVRDAAGRSELGEGGVAGLVGDVLADCELVDEGCC